MKKRLKSRWLLMSLFLIFGCYPVSHILVGEIEKPLTVDMVKVYSDFPIQYKKIAIIESTNEFAFKDISIEFTHQKKTDKALKRLKKEAASLGANGIVILDLSSRMKPTLSVSKESISLYNEKIKAIKVIAIFVE